MTAESSDKKAIINRLNILLTTQRWHTAVTWPRAPIRGRKRFVLELRDHVTAPPYDCSRLHVEELIVNIKSSSSSWSSSSSAYPQHYYSSLRRTHLTSLFASIVAAKSRILEYDHRCTNQPSSAVCFLSAALDPSTTIDYWGPPCRHNISESIDSTEQRWLMRAHYRARARERERDRYRRGGFRAAPISINRLRRIVTRRENVPIVDGFECSIDPPWRDEPYIAPRHWLDIFHRSPLREGPFAVPDYLGQHIGVLVLVSKELRMQLMRINDDGEDQNRGRVGLQQLTNEADRALNLTYSRGLRFTDTHLSVILFVYILFYGTIRASIVDELLWKQFTNGERKNHHFTNSGSQARTAKYVEWRTDVWARNERETSFDALSIILNVCLCKQTK